MLKSHKEVHEKLNEEQKIAEAKIKELEVRSKSVVFYLIFENHFIYFVSNELSF